MFDYRLGNSLAGRRPGVGFTARNWKLSTHKVFAGMICFPDQLGRRLKYASTSIPRGVNLRDHGDAERYADFPRTHDSNHRHAHRYWTLVPLSTPQVR
jgi:hypothetical protein